MAAHLLGAQIRDAAAPDHFAAIEDGVVLGESARELDVLLDEQDGHPAALQQTQHPLDVLHQRWLDPFGRLVEEKESRVRDEKRKGGREEGGSAGEREEEMDGTVENTREEVRRVVRGPVVARMV